MPKFITEDYLKDSYRKEPFTTYELNTGERLTPGGRQYLLDKGIKINSNLPTDNKKSEKKTEEKIITEDKVNKKLIYKFKAIESLTLSCANELLNEDLILAQKVVDIERNIKNIRKFIEGKCELEVINECINKEYLKSCDLEITDIYMHLENSKEIFNLYYLFCKLKEFKYEIIEEEWELLEKILSNLDSIINTLYEMICEATGGMKCQIKK
ncbi:ethanolamine utilization cobalamin adenosyltransferase [Clostridium moniliforme]|uniref:Ethanolamine utilization cobalamin adenosyltransferase n=1 Tax=Clostridium moniliforme TaxID=39489 RepID=A0ABS4F2M5_9CLOT|nr:cobalamin adenosyltransferase [Clostridium moniliforme]MBP1890512.1 ethanolamine utilization cobalamin adenosyltransferase [Clostridium moniliforme]